MWNRDEGDSADFSGHSTASPADEAAQERWQRLEKLKALIGRQLAGRRFSSPSPAPPDSQPPNRSVMQGTIPLHPPAAPASIREHTFSEEAASNGKGAFLLQQTVYPLRQRHGLAPLPSASTEATYGITLLTGAPLWRELQWSDFLFIDIETSGLGTSAGTIAFLIGLGWFEGEMLVVQQFFAREPYEEAAMLRRLAKLSSRFRALVSFNGKSFDLPVIESRMVQARLPLDILDLPHFDLLQAARRVWRTRLPSCALAAIERHVLMIQRGDEDTPGYLIPALYRQYLLTGNLDGLGGVFYHNRLDVVSMVAIANSLCAQAAAVLEGSSDLGGQSSHPLDTLNLGLLAEPLGNPYAAERAYRYALQHALSPPHQQRALRSLATLYRRTHRVGQALPLWEMLATAHNSPEACMELAKHFEWQQKDCHQALHWAKAGLEKARMAHASPAVLRDLEDRRQRLMRKVGRQTVTEAA